MKKLSVILLIALLFLSSCAQNENLQDGVLSAERVVWGDRIYSVQSVPDKGAYLTYTEIGDEDETVYIGCLDPLCTHDPDNCTAYVGYTESSLAFVPQKRGGIFYFFRDINGLGNSSLMALDVKRGKCRAVISLPFYISDTPFLITDSYVYLTLNSVQMRTGGDTQAINIWRAPFDGGELEQVTFAEDIKSGCRLEHYADGVFYYRRGDTLCSTADDFATEEVVMENLNLLWKIMFHGEWIYYTDERKVISVTPDEPKPENYSHVYRYMIGEYLSADSANSCTLMRVKNDGSGVTERVVTGVATCFNLAASNWCIVENTLYCVPAQFELQGKIEWSEQASPNSLSYIWSETGGDLWAVDLETKECREVYTDLGYDIDSIADAGNGKLLVSGKVYDLEKVKAHYAELGTNSSELRYRIWELIDAKLGENA